MLAAFRRHGHTDLQIKGGKDKNGEIMVSLRDLARSYIKSCTKTKLDINRKVLASQLLGPEYINDTWFDKGERVIWFYTSRILNLGHTSSQRSESYHVVISQALGGQLQLEVSAKRLCQHIKTKRKDTAKVEDEPFSRYPRITEGPYFANLRFKITYFALKKVGIEWANLFSLLNQISLT